ncbi:MAG: hypothetical protein AB7S26_21815 [Sandaracinaceae bacterium]
MKKTLLANAALALLLVACDGSSNDDAGPPGRDAGRISVDAGPPRTDAGRDAGSVSMDGGEDAGLVMSDAGSDAGPMMSDAGTDAGPMAMDAGTDAGPTMADAGSDASGLLPTGTSGCAMDSECAAGVCWDFNDYDPFCFGTVCSLGCTTDAECQNAATAAGASSPGNATCGVDGKCDFLGTGLGAFLCA